MSDQQGGPPFEDDDIWSSPEAPVDAAAPAGPRRAPEPRPRRGPARPEGGSRGDRPGEPGAVPAGPTTGPVPVATAIAGPVVDDEHEYVDLPPEGSIPRWLGVTIVLLLLVGVVVGGGLWWYGRQVDPPGGPGAKVSVEVPEGSSTSGIASILESKGVITNSMIFTFYAGRRDAGPFEAGVYDLRENSSFDDVIAALGKGPSGPPSSTSGSVAKVTIPEGYTVAQILERIHSKVPRLSVEALQKALDDRKVPSSLLPDGQSSYEGLLFPATYEVGGGETAVEVLTKMAKEMESRAGALGIDAARAHIKRQWGLDLTGYDMIKVASMIQYEAAIPADAPKIGAVTYNRLKAAMPLQYDSTSIYEAGLEGRGPDQVDYKANTPYNTRVNPGLPPTPIAAPGEYALEGAMEPVDEPWLYFVLTNTKEVTFTVSYQEFLDAKALCKSRNLGCG